VGRCGCWATPTTQRTSRKSKAYEKLKAILPADRLTRRLAKSNSGGDLLLAMCYSRCHPSKKKPSLKYVIPAVVLWTDTMVIPKTAPNPDAAYAWINFMLQPGWQPKFVNGLALPPKSSRSGAVAHKSATIPTYFRQSRYCKVRTHCPLG